MPVVEDRRHLAGRLEVVLAAGQALQVPAVKLLLGSVGDHRSVAPGIPPFEVVHIVGSHERDSGFPGKPYGLFDQLIVVLCPMMLKLKIKVLSEH